MKTSLGLFMLVMLLVAAGGCTTQQVTPAATATLQKLRDQRIRIGTQDLRIAAIVLAAGGTLVTSNLRDFEKVPGLLIEDWNR